MMLNLQPRLQQHRPWTTTGYAHLPSIHSQAVQGICWDSDHLTPPQCLSCSRGVIICGHSEDMSRNNARNKL
jgi:hypothetical protein